jgi:alpha-beta hydrolase superfamily lysophospholipase
MSTEEQIHQITYSDGYRGTFRFWPGGRRGSVLYMHGIQSHGLWFIQSAQMLAQAGLNVLLADRRGSGLNEQDRGDVDSFRRWLADQIELVDWLTRTTGDHKVNLVGVSWGGKLVMGLAKMIPERLASLTLIAPGIFPAVDVSAMQKLRIARAVILRNKTRFPIPLDAPELFTGNPLRQTFIRDDTLKLTHVTGNFLYQSRRLDGFVRTIPSRLTMPIKLFLAGHEQIIDNTRTLHYFRGLRTTGIKELAFYPQACHTLEFEQDNQGFLNDLREWINHATVE